MGTRERLVSDFRAFIRENGLSDSAFGRQVAADAKFMRRLSSGVGITLTVIERAEEYVRSHRMAANKG